MANVPYVWDKLDDGKDIRLLKLLPPGENADQIRCELQKANLQDPERIKYSALSYTWAGAFHVPGDPHLRRQPAVYREIELESHVVQVHDNLYQALVVLSRKGLAEYYWIDALSIDQNDNEEKSAQVQLMAEIFAGADQVIVWVGEADEHSDIALPIIEHLWDNVTDVAELVAKFPTFLAFNDPAFYKYIQRPPITESQWEAIATFFTRRWYRRLWVVQELVLARSACILCGDDVWSWDSALILGIFLYKSAWAPRVRQIYAKDKPIIALGYETLVCIQRLDYCSSDGPNRPALRRMLDTWTEITDEQSKLCAFLGYILDQTRPMSASDPRDKIYAILAMSKWYLRGDGPTLPAPNYNQDVRDVFRDFTMHFLQHSGGLYILSWVDDFRRRIIKDLPSWVPDFSTEMLPHPLIGVKAYNATAGWNYVSPKLEPSTNTLAVSGIFLDTIEEVAPDFIPMAMEQHKFLPLLEMVSRLEGEYLSHIDRLEVFMRTILADKVDEGGTDTNKSRFTPEIVGRSFLAWLMIHIARAIHIGKQVPGAWKTDPNFMTFRGRSLLHSGPSECGIDEFLESYERLSGAGRENQTEAFAERFLKPQRLFASMYDKSIWIRSLMRTRKSSRLGLVAPSVKPGDQIWFLQGGKVPFVFHELPDGNFVLRGEAYVQGLMDGEVFTQLGLSPCDARVVQIK